MNIEELKSDEAILAEFGRRVARRRLDLQMTQAEAARQAGISKRTVERIEAGASAQLSSVVRLFRVLDLLSGLELLLPAEEPRPMELLRLKGKQRQRASSRRRTEQPAAWTWDDDQ